MIFDTAKLLGQQLHDGEVYQNLIKAQTAIDADKTATKLMKDINETEHSIRVLMEMSQADQQQMAELMKQYRTLHETADHNTVFKDYSQAARDFQAIMEQVNQIIQFQLTGEISISCSGNCNSCGNCKHLNEY
ncbi:MAG: YlbF family regulator [Christensenellales bacterium]|jgi:cell fate (sporulation/competence/biofilm development) regulator YlbF (YheA/YmcA/DUF963 family)